MSQKLYAEKVTREQIEDAMKCFFDKGGKITKIQGLQKTGVDHFDPSEAFDDSMSLEVNHIIGYTLE